jgi:hypothetical protein
MNGMNLSKLIRASRMMEAVLQATSELRYRLHMRGPNLAKRS